MIERIKTLFLLFLVLLSFYFSYHLLENRPRFEYLTPAEYEAPQKIGEVRDWSQLIPPKEMIYHYNQKHTKATPGMAQYRILWEDRKGHPKKGLQTWRFTNGKEIRLSATEWNTILEERNGIEFIFHDDLPISLLNLGINLPDQVLSEMRVMSRIWVYLDEEGLIKVLFISDGEQKVYEARLLDQLEGRGLDLNNLVLLGAQLPEQIAVSYRGGGLISPTERNPDFLHQYYLPLEQININQWTYEVMSIDALTMAKALFLDVSVMREIRERDGSYIFTDGSKSLQTKETTYDMRFYVPTYEGYRVNEERFDIMQSLDFINLHQGWTGDYRLYKWRKSRDVETIIYREYIGGYPVYGNRLEKNIGQIMVKYTSHQINEYSRSLAYLGIGKGISTKVMSGQQVLDDLEKRGIHLGLVHQIELAYQGTLSTTSNSAEITFTPVYVVHFRVDREPLFIEARAEGGKEYHGLE